MDERNQLHILWNLNFRSRKKEETSRFGLFRKTPFFEHLSDKQLRVLSNFLHERRYEEGEYLFEINHPGAALFIIATGEVVIEFDHENKVTEIITKVKAGEFLGEMGLLDESPRSASARANQPTLAYALSRADLNRLAKEDPVICMEIYKSLAWIVGERLKATNRIVNIKKKAAA